MPFKDCEEGLKSLLREVKIHQGLADRHIIQFYDTDYVIEDGERRLRLIMEYAEGGSLNMAIPRLQWGDKERITGEIAHGLSYIHSLGIIHCDVKSPNVLLTKNLEVKLCDFGSARTAADKQGSLGTEGWMAPEFLEDATTYSPESDIYALGIVMWEMASSGKSPSTRSQVLREKLDDVPHEYHRIMKACWDEDPKRRPGSKEISSLSHGPSFKEALEKLKQFSLGDDNLDRENLRVPYQHVVDPISGGATRRNFTSDVDVPEQTFLKSPGTPSNKPTVYLKLAIQYYQAGLYDHALDYARRASHYHSGGSYLMGQMYRKGDGVEMNQGEADRWDLKAAEGGFSASQNYIGLRYFQVRNYTEALRWYRKAAEQGDREGEFRLGAMHYYGHGTRKNPQEAEKWMRKAADRGFTPAATGMGIICLEQERYREAMTWCLMAREDPISEYHIGCLFRYGFDVLPNYVAAMEWFQRSAKKEYGLAESAIGWMYRNGVGVSEDLEEAEKWYRKAEEHGDLDAANELAMALSDIGAIEEGFNIGNLLEKAEEKGHPLASANILLREM
ncbi:hypothetical protein EC957_000159 [Mortierella hygrophila]|uniref:Protein kinase domain-containing protein n=1 Tax=Mortierella hygrophila TaxID=979708 RepID=A0A9P6FGK4_9FUNG|nr:hypothetical protein EC957_000159 [Mortierella hygrophila]